MSTRKVVEQLKARATSDGAGVKLLRVFGGQGPERFDPFLMLDEFGSEEASDYIGGFPSHPHRGFETITYMLEGKMEHRDHMENVGLLNDGDVQWMTAGSGIIHSEMPRQTEGKMRGFQLWLNLPAATKMQKAHYSDVPADQIPQYTLANARVKAIAGKTQLNGQEIVGHFDVVDTHAQYFDFHLDAGAELTIPVSADLNALVYVYEGALAIGQDKVATPSQTLARLDSGDDIIVLNSGNEEARFLVIAGKALKEPIAQYGPFVMNTPEEIDQAIRDYQSGKLTA